MNVANWLSDDDDSSRRPRKIVELAQKEAQRLGHNFVGTEQIFIALILFGGSLKPVFEKFGITVEWARAEVEKRIGRGTGAVTPDLSLTPMAKRVLELSYVEARELGHDFIAPEHLMLAVLRSGGGVAGAVLKEEGINTDRLRKAILVLLDEPEEL